MKSRLAKLEKEKKELEEANDKLQQKVTRFLVNWSKLDGIYIDEVKHKNMGEQFYSNRGKFL